MALPFDHCKLVWTGKCLTGRRAGALPIEWN
jgi:hypothetical protein